MIIEAVSESDHAAHICLTSAAGEIMYKQGRRFAEGTSSKVSAFELAAMQARSYLAAINALSLVDERNAWIALPAASRQDRVSGHRAIKVWNASD